jgi:hypothetical protein
MKSHLTRRLEKHRDNAADCSLAQPSRFWSVFVALDLFRFDGASTLSPRYFDTCL